MRLTISIGSILPIVLTLGLLGRLPIFTVLALNYFPIRASDEFSGVGFRFLSAAITLQLMLKRTIAKARNIVPAVFMLRLFCTAIALAVGEAVLDGAHQLLTLCAIHAVGFTVLVILEIGLFVLTLGLGAFITLVNNWRHIIITITADIPAFFCNDVSTPTTGTYQTVRRESAQRQQPHTHGDGQHDGQRAVHQFLHFNTSFLCSILGRKGVR